MAIDKAKRKAKALLTGFIRQIAEEEHSDPVITGPGIDGAAIVTKAEALARFIWRASLGYKDNISIIDKKTGEVTRHERIVGPDKHYIDIVLDRMEGKVAPAEPEKVSANASVADKVTKQGKNRLNNIAKR